MYLSRFDKKDMAVSFVVTFLHLKATPPSRKHCSIDYYFCVIGRLSLTHMTFAHTIVTLSWSLRTLETLTMHSMRCTVDASMATP